MPAGVASGTTADAAFIFPPHAVSARQRIRTVPVGSDLLSRMETVYWNPFALYDLEELHSLNACYMGDVGHGKSGVIKTTVRRLLILPQRLDDGTIRNRRGVAVDLKGEYQRLTESLGCTPVVLGHDVCLNPLDPRLTPQQHLALLESFLRLLMDRRLSGFEKEIVAEAYDQARANTDTLVLEDVRHALMHLPAEFVDESLHTRAEVDHAASEMAFALKQLIRGSLRGMFDGPTTDTLNWSGRMVDIVVHPDYRTSHRELVYQLLVVLVAVWLDRAWKDPHQRIDFFVIDEAWDATKVRQFAELLQDATKLGRSRGLSVLTAFHGPTDADSAGDVGEVQRDIARRLLKEMGSYFLFHMSVEDAEVLRGILKLSDDDVDLITELEAHQFLLVMGSGRKRRRFFVRHQITGLPTQPGGPLTGEALMVDTDPDQ